MATGDRVNLVKGPLPEAYHCTCSFCQKALGELRPSADGPYYSRLERRQYYESKIESGREGHAAKTPLHVARWAIQKYTAPGDWVLDPTIGAGTTAVESITQGRNVAGMEVQYAKILQANIAKNLPKGIEARIRIGDARNIGRFLREIGKRFSLIVNNPPYSGDEHQTSLVPEGYKHQSKKFTYEEGLPNLAFLKENAKYWETMASIYRSSLEYLVPGGHLVIGIKDMVRNKAPFLLHEKFCQMISMQDGISFVGTAVLRHYPSTMAMNTYPKRFPDVKIPLYQTINVFKKKGKK